MHALRNVSERTFKHGIRTTSFLLPLAGIFHFAYGVYFMRIFDENQYLWDKFQYTDIHRLMIVTGLMMAVIGIFGAHLSFALTTFLSDEVKYCTFRYKKLVTPYILILFAFSVLSLIIAVMCFDEKRYLRDNLYHSIDSAILEYNRSYQAKLSVDTLQLDYECCGSRKYDEWFDVRWQDIWTAPDGNDTK